MSTYGDKVRKWRKRIETCQELGLPVPEWDVQKLLYYVGRAEKKGANHETKPKDDWYWARKKIERAYQGHVPPGAASAALRSAALVLLL